MGRTPILTLAAWLGVVACADRGAAPNTTARTTAASAPGFTRPAASATDGVGRSADAAPEPSTSGSAGAAASSGAAAADTGSAAEPSSAASAVPLPAVEIATYGMHIGGGPNDKESKAPLREAIMARRDAFRACFALVEDQTKTGTFGVDLRIPGSGGRPEVSKPRPGLKGPGVDECVLRAFESVEFQKPPKGTAMVVSCSLRFTPKR